MKFCAFFIVEGAKLEAQALLLADSLRQHHPPDLDCIAYVPEHHLPALRPFTRRFLAARGVEIRPLLVREGQWRRPYPHGNKLLACAEPRAAEYSIFLDTDTCCCGPLTPPVVPGDGRIHAVPDGVRTWGAQERRWERAYAFFGLEVPEERVRLVRHARKMFVPYFNAGYVAFPERHPDSGARFGADWLQTAVAFDFGAKIAGKRPWLDQIALPLTLYRFGYGFNVLEDRYNFSTKAREPEGEVPRLAHYHRDAGFVRWAAAGATFERFVDNLRAVEGGAEELGTVEGFLDRITGKRS